MSSVSFPRPFVPTAPDLEALDLADVGARPTPEQDADAFPDPDDYPTDEDFARMEAHNLRLRAEAGDGPTPTRPGGAALPADFAASAGRYSDSQLITAIELADSEPNPLALTGDRRQAWLAAMTAEVLRRIDARPAAAA